MKRQTMWLRSVIGKIVGNYVIGGLAMAAAAWGMPLLAQEEAAPDDGAAAAEENSVDATDVAPADETTPLEGETAAATPAPEKKVPYDFVSDGKRIDIKDGDLSIEPPTGWEIFTSHATLTLLMQMKRDPKIKYQRTIQVASFDGPRYMDDTTAKDFEELIVRKFAAISASIVDYKLRSHNPIEMTDGRPAILFYTEFKFEDLPLMQAHILVSSKDRHYLLTFTDVAEHFENDAAGQFLTEAWTSMTSVQLKGKTPRRYQSVVQIGIGIGVLLALAAIFGVWRNNRAKRDYAYYGSGKGLDDVDNDDLRTKQKKRPRSTDYMADTGDDEGDAPKKPTRPKADSAAASQSRGPTGHSTRSSLPTPPPPSLNRVSHPAVEHHASEENGLDFDDEDDKSHKAS